MGTVALRVLGPVIAEIDGRTVELGGPQQRAVLACLVMQAGAVVGPSTIIDRLWPEAPPASATKLIQKYVSGLRAALGRDAIQTTGGGYRLSVDPGDIDVVRFEQAIGRPGALPDDAPSFSGPPYSGCGELPFVVNERERLMRVRLEAQLDRCAGLLDAGSFGSVVGDLERLALEHPEHERVVALLVRGLYASDRPVDALRAYRRYEDHVRQELGVDPSPELAELEGRVLRHDESLRIARAPTTQPADAIPDVPREGVPSPVVEEVRPVVVVLALDPAEGDDPDDRRVRQRLFDDQLTDLAARFGAHLEAVVGDEAIMFFGVPARDDDLDRAVALGRAIVDARPTAQVACVDGDAVVAVEPAARLLAGAVIDRVRALALDAAPGQLVADDVIDRIEHSRDPENPRVVGRDHERRLICDVWRRVVDDHRLRVIEIIGEAGIGKSRLVRAATGSFDPSPSRVIELGYSAFGDGLLFAALRSSLRTLSDGFDDVEEWLGTFGLQPAARRRLSGRLRPLLEPAGDGGPDGPDEWVTPVVQLYDELAARGPLVLVVEDAHWSRPETFRWLNDALADLGHRPILAIVTRRPDPSPIELDVSGVAERASLRLQPLDPSASTDLAEDVGAGLDPSALRTAVEHSGGNPLFLLHYLRMRRDRPDTAADVAPDSVRRVISSRLDLLASPLRATIQAASLVPERSTARTIARIADRDEREVAAALNVLVRTGLLRRAGGGAGTSVATHEFQHALVADVAYGQLTRPTRIELHRRAALTLEVVERGSLDDLQSIAWHWLQVVRLSGSEGIAVDAGDRRAAIAALDRAASALLHVDARLAVQAFRRAVALTGDNTTQRGELLMRLGAVSADAGDFDGSRRALAEAASIFDALDDAARGGEAIARLARTLWYLGRGDDIDRLLAESSARLDLVPPTPSHAHAQVVIATQAALRGRSAASLAIAERIRPVVDEFGTVEDSIRLLHAQGHARFDLDDATGVEHLEEALQRTREHGFGRLQSQSYNNLAEVIWFARGPDHAIGLARQGLDLAVESGYLGQASWHVGQLAELSLDRGDWTEVLDEGRVALTLTPVVAWLLRSLEARVRFWRGDDDALAALDDALESARVTDERQVVIPMLSAAIAAHAAVGHDDVAASLGAELTSFARDHGHHRLREAGEVARGLCPLGRIDLVRELVPQERPRILRRQLMWDTAQARIAEASGHWDDALHRYELAERGWIAFPHPYEAAHAAAGRARVAERLSLGDDARASRARAQRCFRELGALRSLRALGVHDPERARDDS